MSNSPLTLASDLPAAGRDDLAERWAVLHEAAGVVALLAGVPALPADPGAQALPARLRRIGGWRLTLGRQAMADLSAILEGGIKALLAVQAAGAPPVIAAQALWDEFIAAREGLLALAGPGSDLHSS